MDHKHKIKRELILVLKAPKGELVVVRLLDLLQFHIPTQKWLIAVLKLILGSMVPMEELEVQHLLDLEFHHNQSMDQQHKIKQEPHLVSMAPKGELVVVQLLDLLTFHIPI